MSSEITINQASASTTKHPTLYFEDGNLVIRVKESKVLFNLFRGRCRRASALIFNLVPAEPPSAAASATSAAGYGATPETADHFQEMAQGTASDPLVLSLKFEEFELAAGWMIGELARPISTHQWILLLEAADYLDMAVLRKEAISQLSPHVEVHISPNAKADLRPAHALFLARRYRVHAWLKPSLTGFLSTPPPDLKPEDLVHAGENTALSYIQLQHNASSFRMAVILWPPSITHDSTCHGEAHTRCKAAFTHWWHSKISTLLIEHRAFAAANGVSFAATYKRVKDRLDVGSYAALAALDDTSFQENVIRGMNRKCQANGLEECLRHQALNSEEGALRSMIETLLAEDTAHLGMDIDSNVTA